MLYLFIQCIFCLMTFLHCKLLYKTLEYLGTGIGNGINRMPHSIDQTFFIKCLLIQQRLKIGTDLIIITPVRQYRLHILEHLRYFDIRPSMLRTFQGCHCRSDGRISIRTGRGNHVRRKSGVITTAMVHMKYECDI